jgi:hypothetical protein
MIQLYKTIIVVVLYGREAWSLTLRIEHAWKVAERKG